MDDEGAEKKQDMDESQMNVPRRIALTLLVLMVAALYFGSVIAAVLD